MKDTLSNKLSSFNATLAVADDPQYTGIWQNQPPLAFTEKLGAIHPAVAALATAGAAQSIPTIGNTKALRDLRGQFEKGLLPITRAVFRCLTDLGRIEDAAKADLHASDLHNARANALAGMGETVLDLAEPLSGAEGENYGINASSLTPVDELWTRYSTAVGAPQGARAKRKAKTNTLPSQFAVVEVKFTALDDLVLQFNGTPLGELFVEAWFNARHVADLGHRFAKPATPTPPVPPTPPQP